MKKKIRYLVQINREEKKGNETKTRAAYIQVFASDAAEARASANITVDTMRRKYDAPVYIRALFVEVSVNDDNS